MDIPQIRKLRPKLAKFLKRFDNCFPRKDTRAHLPTYITGQLSDLPEKSVEADRHQGGCRPLAPSRSSSASTSGTMT